MIKAEGLVSMSNEELINIDGGVGLLAAALICGGCFLGGAAIVGGILWLIG